MRMLATTSQRPDLHEALREIGWPVATITDATDLSAQQPDSGWDALIVDVDDDERSRAVARRVRDTLGFPVFWSF